jgi:hypothetical protein
MEKSKLTYHECHLNDHALVGWFDILSLSLQDAKISYFSLHKAK